LNLNENSCLAFSTVNFPNLDDLAVNKKTTKK